MKAAFTLYLYRYTLLGLTQFKQQHLVSNSQTKYISLTPLHCHTWRDALTEKLFSFLYEMKMRYMTMPHDLYCVRCATGTPDFQSFIPLTPAELSEG